MRLFVGMRVSANTRPAGHKEELRQHIPPKSQCSCRCVCTVQTYSMPKKKTNHRELPGFPDTGEATLTFASTMQYDHLCF